MAPTHRLPQRPSRRRAVPVRDLDDKCRVIFNQACADAREPWLIDLATGIQSSMRLDSFAHWGAYNLARLRRLWEWQRANVAYINDGGAHNASGVMFGYDENGGLTVEPGDIAADERLQTAEVTLRNGAGDCDCQVALFLAMVLATFDDLEPGIPCCLPALGGPVSPEGAPMWSHIYCMTWAVGLPGPLPIDPTSRPGSAFGGRPGGPAWAHSVYLPDAGRYSRRREHAPTLGAEAQAIGLPGHVVAQWRRDAEARTGVRGAAVYDESGRRLY